MRLDVTAQVVPDACRQSLRQSGWGVVVVSEPGVVEIASISSPQRTICRSVRFSGLGLHTGIWSEVTIEPAPINYGIRFSSKEKPLKELRLKKGGKTDFVYESNHTVSVYSDGALFICVEHLMSCLHALQITNARVRFLAGEEFPIVDGSAAPILSQLSSGGIVDQSAPASAFFIRKPLRVSDSEGRQIWANPAPELIVHAHIDFPHPIGQQNYSCVINEATFCEEIADARTFLRDSVSQIPLELVRASRLRGLAGPPIERCQAVVYDDQTYLSRLRFKDEAVRHKILDFIGDIYTAGRPVCGEFHVFRPGHSFSLKFAKLLQQAAAIPRAIESSAQTVAPGKVDLGTLGDAA